MIPAVVATTGSWDPPFGGPNDGDEPPSGFRASIAAGRLEQPGAGRTLQRFLALARASRRSLSDGRLVEAHADGQSILLEAGWTEPESLGALGVWASAGGPAPVELVRGSGGARLRGTKVFCSGAALLDHALVTATTAGTDRVVLGLIDLHHPGVRVLRSDWVGLGMRGAHTRTVDLDDVPVVAVVGEPGWYLERAGFWHGAVGVAASWYGGAIGVIATVRTLLRRGGPHELAHLGEAEAVAYAIEATLERAARQIDDDPHDLVAAHERALQVRRTVADGCLAIIEHAGGALGPRPLAFDGDHAQRVADLEVYVRQDHGRRDSEALGRLTIDRTRTSC